MSFSIAQILGQTNEHVVQRELLPVYLAKDTARAFLAIRKRALKDGIDLWPVSGFRAFATQVAIWQQKWKGQRVLYDRRGRGLVTSEISNTERLKAILAWSAPPGASRHHWGSDVDVVDRSVLTGGYALKLIPSEYQPGGPMERLGMWLDQNLKGSDFYRPYRRDHGGVQPEPWHISHYPVARECSMRLREAHLRRALAEIDEPWAVLLIKKLPVIYRQYVRSVDKP